MLRLLLDEAFVDQRGDMFGEALDIRRELCGALWRHLHPAREFGGRGHAAPRVAGVFTVGITPACETVPPSAS